MNSSRTTTIGIMLILLVFFGWMIFNQPKRPPQPAKPAVTQQTPAQTAPAAATMAAAPSGSHSTLFPVDSGTTAASKHVETPLVSAVISSHGGNIVSWVLKNYKTWEHKPLELVDQSIRSGDVNLSFVAGDGKKVSTKDLPFVVEDKSDKTLGEKDSATIRLVARIDSAASIEKEFTFHGDKYEVTIRYRILGMQSKISGYRYVLSVDNPVPYNESRPDDESAAAKAFIVSKSGSEEIDANKNNDPQHKAVNGDVDYVAARTKYFLAAMIPQSPRPLNSEVSGNSYPLGENGRVERYAMTVSTAISTPVKDSLTVDYYLGPLEYNRISTMVPPLDNTMDFGWRFLVRPISIYVLFPFIMMLHSFISNWGIVIILFSIVIKLVTMPFTRSQMAAMRKMQALQPMLTELREKHKADQQKQQEETFKLYRTYGVNPAGGCLPMLLQMPILFALYAVLRNVIELRQAPFFGWITDLSLPDALIKFGTHVPILGDQLSGLTLLMAATMLIQSALQTTDPRQKAMAYIMPLFFTVLFNNLPSGVALYYFMFNLFGIAQQLYNKNFLPPLDLEKLKEEAKGKKGFMARMQEMEATARQQRQTQMAGKGQAPGRKKK
ncbi:MAG: membrane protein insertase YidC [Bacteroidetes bacterium]|nr:membrane protein insertase YidC [Bacteroidota bacterium]